MSHVRQQVRGAVASALASVGTVSTSRVYPVQDLPILLVYTTAEEIDGEETAFAVLERRLSVVVEAIAGGDAIDDRLDALAVGIEAALNGSTLGGLVVHLVPRGVEITLSAEGNQPIGRARMTFEALYRTAYADPETSL